MRYGLAASSWFVVLALLGAMLSGRAAAYAEDDAALVTVEDIVVKISGIPPVETESLPPETLCNLHVVLRNDGTQNAYSFGFDVEINGEAVPVYDNVVYFQAIEPGASGTIALYNFYSPAESPDGTVEITVNLRKARWVEIKQEDEAQVWTPTGDVEGLPSAKTVQLPLQAADD